MNNSDNYHEDQRGVFKNGILMSSSQIVSELHSGQLHGLKQNHQIQKMREEMTTLRQNACNLANEIANKEQAERLQKQLAGEFQHDDQLKL
tara:strand:- start:32 stop:304 length:273 start_codon:yes stop_codon:yes gene_type:complete